MDEIKPDSKKKLNCWELMKCGRELGGERSLELGVCPAATQVMMDGIHNGSNGGRACWVISGTMCDDCIQGTFAEKYDDCGQCEFYEYVRSEEGEGLITAANLLEKLK